MHESPVFMDRMSARIVLDDDDKTCNIVGFDDLIDLYAAEEDINALRIMVEPKIRIVFVRRYSQNGISSNCAAGVAASRSRRISSRLGIRSRGVLCSRFSAGVSQRRLARRL